MWAEELRHVELSSDVGRAEQCLQMHSDAALHVQNCIIEVMQVGQDLLPVCRNLFLISTSLARLGHSSLLLNGVFLDSSVSYCYH